MSTYSNWLQSALQNLLQCIVRFFHPRSSCLTHISADVCGGRKSLVKPVTWQNISSCSVLSPEIVMHDDVYIGRRSDNNIKCVVQDDLGWKNRTTRYILPRRWLYKWFSLFHRCGTYSVLSRSSSIHVCWYDIHHRNNSLEVKRINLVACLLINLLIYYKLLHIPQLDHLPHLDPAFDIFIRTTEAEK